MEDKGMDRCAICLHDVRRGQAILTAECSHTFHLRCISDNVAHGNRECPLCKASWRDVPAVDPPVPAQRRRHPRVYADDDPVAAAAGEVQAQAAGVGAMVLKTHCERPAVPRAASREGFAVLVHATAPGGEADAPRAPLDLVTVLDVSGSMSGGKLRLLKQAMGFVIDNLGSADRLSVVSFSDRARRVIRLARMSGDGKASAKLAVESLAAGGGTNIRKGLDVASQVLAGRRHSNAVTSVILLSDGQDTCGNSGRNRYIHLVPRPLRGAGGTAVPVHTFGFGTDHDAAAMHAVAEATGGTFSFIEGQDAIQDSFAQCIGGLLSVAVQEVRVAVACVHPGVRVREVKSGRYDSLVAADGRAASVDVGELYADEERRFLVLVDVPEAAGVAEEATQLLRVRCTYRETATGRAADVAGDDAVVLRPVEVPEGGDADQLSMDVALERVRVAATEDIAAARAAAERGAHAEAARVLDRRLEAVRRSAPAMAGDATCAALEDELRDLRAGVASRREYEQTGRAMVLEGMSSHRMQRASVRAVREYHRDRAGGAERHRDRERSRVDPYLTRAMRGMVLKSRRARMDADDA